MHYSSQQMISTQLRSIGRRALPSQSGCKRRLRAREISTSHSPTHFIKGGTPCDPKPPRFRLADYGEDSLYTLVLLRHGESEWNAQNRYTGWCDVNLTKRGQMEARTAGRLLYENGIEIDHAFTSVLKRASFSTNMALNTANQHWVPVTKTWRLSTSVKLRCCGSINIYILTFYFSKRRTALWCTAGIQ